MQQTLGSTPVIGMGSSAARRREDAAWQRRTHHVDVVVVTHDAAHWLPRTLGSLKASTVSPDRVVAVDVGSVDETPQLLRQHPVVDEVVDVPRDSGFPASVGAAVAQCPHLVPDAAAPGGVEEFGGEPLQWVWILHDDSAPEPEALDALLREADRSPSATILGPKVHGWSSSDLLVECGLSMTGSGRRVAGVEHHEVDQGQHDDLDDVLAVGSAGMLVQRSVWDRLGGFDSSLAFYRNDIEFCWRARRADERVIVVPEAVLHHEEAAARGRREVAAVDVDPVTADRRSALYTLLVHTPSWRLPFTSVRLLLGSLLRSLLLLVRRAPKAAWRETGAWFWVHARPGRVSRARRAAAETATVDSSEISELRPGAVEQFGHLLDSLSSRSSMSPAVRAARGPLRLDVAAAVTLALVLVSFFVTRSLWTSPGDLSGGALFPAPETTMDLWTRFQSAWHDVGLGSQEASAPYPLVLFAIASIPWVGPDDVVALLLLVTAPLAGLSAFLSLRGILLPARVVLSLAYAMLPATLMVSGDGRLGTAVAAIAMPPIARLIARMVLAPVEAREDPHRPRPLPPAGARTAAALGLLLSVLTAFVPLMWPLAATIMIVGSAFTIRSLAGWARVILAVLTPLALLWPWSLRLLNEPFRFTLEAGLPLDVGELPHSAVRLLLLDPGNADPSVTILGLVILPLAVLALLAKESRPVVATGWAVFALAFLVGAGQSRVAVTLPEFPEPVVGYPGPITVVMAVALIAALGVRASLPRFGTVSRSGWTKVPAAAALLLAATTVLSLWATSPAGPLGRVDTGPVPAFVAEGGLSPERTRALVLESEDSDLIEYSLVNGAGPLLGDADVLPPTTDGQMLDTAVADLVAGVGGGEINVLRRSAIAYVVADADGVAADALDSNPYLRHVSTSDGVGLWEVLGLTSRVRASVGDEVEAVPAVPVGADVPPVQLVDAPLTTEGRAATVDVGVTPDPDWVTLIDGQQVKSGDLGGLLTFDVPADAEQSTVDLSVAFAQAPRDRSLLVSLAALLLLLVALIPPARPQTLLDPNEDVEADQLDPVVEPDEHFDVTDGATPERVSS